MYRATIPVYKQELRPNSSYEIIEGYFFNQTPKGASFFGHHLYVEIVQQVLIVFELFFVGH